MTTFYVKCTTCKQTKAATQEQLTEAREMGCVFSACCGAVATVSKVETKPDQKPRSARR